MFPLPIEIKSGALWLACPSRVVFRQGKQRFLLSDRAGHHYAPGGLLVDYYQYVTAYQEKIRARGENDATMARLVFTDISRKFFRGADASAGTAPERFERVR